MTAKAASAVACAPQWINSVKAVVAIPSIRLSTIETRRAMPKASPSAMLPNSCTTCCQGYIGNGDLIADGMHDRLHEPPLASSRVATR